MHASRGAEAYETSHARQAPVEERVALLREALRLSPTLDASHCSERLDDVEHDRLPQEAEEDDVEAEEGDILPALAVLLHLIHLWEASVRMREEDEGSDGVVFRRDELHGGPGGANDEHEPEGGGCPGSSMAGTMSARSAMRAHVSLSPSSCPYLAQASTGTRTGHAGAS